MTIMRDQARIHDEAIELIPWLVNGRLQASDVAWLERHVQECDVCQHEVTAQRAVRQAVRNSESNVEHAPHAALQKLWARIDQSAPASVIGRSFEDRPSASPNKGPEPVSSHAARWRIAAGAILVLGVGLVTAYSRGIYLPGFAPEYRTATAGRSVPDRTGQIRAVFSSTVTVEELTQIVGSTNLRIVDGPSAAGVYTLALQSQQTQPMADVLARLRSDPRVQLAEPVVVEPRGPP